MKGLRLISLRPEGPGVSQVNSNSLDEIYQSFSNNGTSSYNVTLKSVCAHLSASSTAQHHPRTRPLGGIM